MQQKQKFLSIFSNIESTFPSNQLLKIPALDWKWFLIIFPLEFVLIYLLKTKILPLLLSKNERWRFLLITTEILSKKKKILNSKKTQIQFHCTRTKTIISEY